MKKVQWTTTAQKHLDAIYDYIAQDSEIYALRVVDRITTKSEQIAEFPLSGRRVPEYDTDEVREVFITPYRLIYYIGPEKLDILAVIHSAREIAGKPLPSQ